MIETQPENTGNVGNEENENGGHEVEMHGMDDIFEENDNNNGELNLFLFFFNFFLLVCQIHKDYNLTDIIENNKNNLSFLLSFNPKKKM